MSIVDNSGRGFGVRPAERGGRGCAEDNGGEWKERPKHEARQRSHSISKAKGKINLG